MPAPPTLADPAPAAPRAGGPRGDDRRAGDEHAGDERWRVPLERLAAERYQHFYRAILRRVGNEADAADLAQETFVIAAASLPKFRGEALLSSWVFGIAMNVIRDHRRKRFAQRWIGVKSDEDAALSTDLRADPVLYPDPLDALLVSERLREVVDAMDLLRPETREALWRAAVSDCDSDYATLAAELGVPTGTLKSRVSRARAMIKASLARLNNDGHAGNG
ncbi:MAG: RNA polymerase sigma factor [Janthinobacterium lividum]